MRHRKLVMILLGLGVIGGYGSGFAHMAHCEHWRDHRRQALMNEFAHACVDAAQSNADKPHPGAIPPASPAAPTAAAATAIAH